MEKQNKTTIDIIENPYLINGDSFCKLNPISERAGIKAAVINVTDLSGKKDFSGLNIRTIKTSNKTAGVSIKKSNDPKTLKIPPNLFRLYVKNGEYVYARPNDIILIESCDHLVKVYLAFADKIKKTIRHNTLKDFLALLPQQQFIRIGRFCAINTYRLSGGSCNNQTFEFDFLFSVKTKHSIPISIFNKIGK